MSEDAKEPECEPMRHEFVPPIVLEKKVGRQRYKRATSICVKCGKTKTWSV